MDETLIYALAVYFWFHLVSESDLLARPRAWWMKTLPGWLTYPTTCAFCFCGWVSIAFTTLAFLSSGYLLLSPRLLFGAPVICHLLGLIARRLQAPSTTQS